jgi:hypothetical protein
LAIGVESEHLEENLNYYFNETGDYIKNQEEVEDKVFLFFKPVYFADINFYRSSQTLV